MHVLPFPSGVPGTKLPGAVCVGAFFVSEPMGQCLNFQPSLHFKEEFFVAKIQKKPTLYKTPFTKAYWREAFFVSEPMGQCLNFQPSLHFKEEFFVAKIQKKPTLYKTPFTKAYWRDAALELKDTRVLVFAALMIALRVALKGLYIPLGPTLRINSAFFINALGAMVFGPVVAGLAAIVSDFLGYILWPQVGPYFLPYALIEISGSMIFALFLYRAKVTPTRVILSRFCNDFFVNIVLNAPITYLFYKMVLGKSYMMFQIPHIVKNLAMFPIESVLLTVPDSPYCEESGHVPH